MELGVWEGGEDQGIGGGEKHGQNTLHEVFFFSINKKQTYDKGLILLPSNSDPFRVDHPSDEGTYL